MYRAHKLSVVIPCHNEELGIAEVLRRIPTFIDEVIVVDNDSTDNTAAIAQGLGARVIRENVRGYGAAYQAGLPKATGDVIITLDGDGSYPPEEIYPLVDALIDQAQDFVSACRFPLLRPSSMSRTNRFGNWLLTAAVAALFRRRLSDSQSGMWAFRRGILEHLQLTSRGMSFSEEIKLAVLLSGMRFSERHIPYCDRLGRVKLRKWRDGFGNMLFLIRRRARMRA